MPARHRNRTPHLTWLWRALALLALSFVALQLFWLLRVLGMVLIDPSSTSFQRSEAWRLWASLERSAWSQGWRDSDDLSSHLKRAVIASEDAGFVEHTGVEWDAIERAWERQQQVDARTQPGSGKSAMLRPAAARATPGGSTITQQLAKNLFLSGERTTLRKAQEFVITTVLETVLSKERILEIYLNHVEWGEGLFGAPMAARYYFRVDVSRLTKQQAAKLAVMLPAPKRFEKRPQSAYLEGRTAAILRSMDAVELP